MCFYIKISSDLRKTKKKPFFAFFCVTLKIIFKWPPIGVQSRAPLSAELACWWQKMLIQAFEVRATGTKL